MAFGLPVDAGLRHAALEQIHGRLIALAMSRAAPIPHVATISAAAMGYGVVRGRASHSKVGSTVTSLGGH